MKLRIERHTRGRRLWNLGVWYYDALGSIIFGFLFVDVAIEFSPPWDYGDWIVGFGIAGVGVCDNALDSGDCDRGVALHLGPWRLDLFSRWWSHNPRGPESVEEAPCQS